MVYI
jgi:hypothetical protein